MSPNPRIHLLCLVYRPNPFSVLLYDPPLQSSYPVFPAYHILHIINTVISCVLSSSQHHLPCSQSSQWPSVYHSPFLFRVLRCSYLLPVCFLPRLIIASSPVSLYLPFRVPKINLLYITSFLCQVSSVSIFCVIFILSLCPHLPLPWIALFPSPCPVSASFPSCVLYRTRFLHVLCSVLVRECLCGKIPWKTVSLPSSMCSSLASSGEPSLMPVSCVPPVITRL